MDQYVLLAAILSLVGFALIVAELFVPSGGLISILSLVSFVTSLWFAYRAWWDVTPGYFWTFGTTLFLGIPAFILLLFRLIETTSLGDRILLAAPKSEDVTPYKDEEARMALLIGKHGRALTMLNPGGLVRVEGQRLHAVSEGMVIDPDEWIEILEIRGSRVLVRRISAADVALSTAQESPATESPVEPKISAPPPPTAPLDFDMPQG